MRPPKKAKKLQEHILALDYEKVRVALSSSTTDSLSNLVRMELAYVYNESGNYREAQEILSGSLPRQVQSQQSRADVREVLANINPEHYQFLEQRYFPQMLEVAGGMFQLGPFRGDQQVTVTIRSISISATPITVWQYHIYMRDTEIDRDTYRPTKRYSGNHPMVNLSWYDAIEYANWLSLHQGLDPVYQILRNREDPHNYNSTDPYKWTVHINPEANGYRLPTEAEWEYAAGGGPKGHGYAYSGSDALDTVAWYADNTSIIQAVAQKVPNELGIYDMSGLVWEWCWDWDSPYQPGTWDQPRGALQGEYRNMRGGSFRDVADQCLVINRGTGNPHYGGDTHGMRLVRLFL